MSTNLRPCISVLFSHYPNKDVGECGKHGINCCIGLKPVKTSKGWVSFPECIPLCPSGVTWYTVDNSAYKMSHGMCTCILKSGRSESLHVLIYGALLCMSVTDRHLVSYVITFGMLFILQGEELIWRSRFSLVKSWTHWMIKPSADRLSGKCMA